ncbi:amidohydrolase family protein [Parvularcula oceani]|uniref:amidohydrolase family protein n=1 Tax=Parvularcula oceani TaxID=1247963 RepID=UPI0006911B10|nr:amidohydrolase family protein [Parvularcula oceani]
MRPSLTRRRFAAASLATLPAARSLTLAQDHGTRPLLLKGAHVLTMAPGGDRPRTDVLIRGQRIAEVDRGLSAEGAEVMDCSGRILMPGFVGTHNHLWLSQMRGLFGRSEDTRYFPLSARLGAAYRPEDMYAGTLFGAAGAIEAGITTSFAYCDNIRSRESAEAALEALAASGIRSRFYYAGHDDLPSGEFLELDHIAMLHESWGQWSNGGLLGLGFGWRVPPAGSSESAFERAARELAFVRDLGLPLSSHISGENGPAQMAALIERGWLGEDMLLVHATGAAPEQLRAVRERGASVVLTPITEHRVGFGLTLFSQYAPALPRISLGLDGALGGAPDMFAVMKMLHNVQAGASGEELSVLPRRILEHATIRGAEAVGLGDEIGSVEPGKRADLILIDPDALNMGAPEEDPSALLVYSAQPQNVVLVLVDGRIVKRGQRLTALDGPAITRAAARSIRGVRQRAD